MRCGVLPLAQRETVTLRLEGLSHREIAQVLGISENYVVVRLTRARAELVSEIRNDRRDRLDHTHERVALSRRRARR
jgi:DNA-directed RNA polymerase specialized sigma24 family protein